MQVLIVSNSEGIGPRLRQGLLREGQECPTGHVVSLERGTARLAELQPELVAVVLLPDPQKLAELAGCKARNPQLSVGAQGSWVPFFA